MAWDFENESIKGRFNVLEKGFSHKNKAKATRNKDVETPLIILRISDHAINGRGYNRETRKA
ncbi:MAG: hypothetical protein ACR2J3_01530 [Aridibacter sp.]